MKKVMIERFSARKLQEIVMKELVDLCYQWGDAKEFTEKVNIFYRYANFYNELLHSYILITEHKAHMTHGNERVHNR